MTPRDYASALYRAVRGKGKKDVDAGISGLIAALKARGSVRLLPQILAEMPEAINDAEAVNRITIETAHELDDKMIQRIAQASGALEDADVQQVVKPELIGGARIKKHDVTIDASVRGKLERIRAAFAKED